MFCGIRFVYGPWHNRHEDVPARDVIRVPKSVGRRMMKPGEFLLANQSRESHVYGLVRSRTEWGAVYYQYIYKGAE